MIESVDKKWNEIFVLNDLYWESVNEYQICRNVLKYPERVREFLDSGYWWSNDYEDCYRPGRSFSFGNNADHLFPSLLAELEELYEIDLKPIHIYGNCFSNDMRLSNMRSILPHVDSDEASERGIAFNLNLTQSNDVKTSFWSWRNKKSAYQLNENEVDELNEYFEQLNQMKGNSWIQIDNQTFDFRLEYLASIEYNSMIVYPSHYWHNLYMKENWFEEKNRVTLTGFFTTT